MQSVPWDSSSDLFKCLFHLKPHLNSKNIARIGGADLQLRPEMMEKYIQYTPYSKIEDCKANWFYVEYHAPALLE